MRTFTLLAAAAALALAWTPAEAGKSKSPRVAGSLQTSASPKRTPPPPTIFSNVDIPDWAKVAFAPRGQR